MRLWSLLSLMHLGKWTAMHWHQHTDLCYCRVWSLGVLLSKNEILVLRCMSKLNFSTVLFIVLFFQVYKWSNIFQINLRIFLCSKNFCNPMMSFPLLCSWGNCCLLPSCSISADCWWVLWEQENLLSRLESGHFSVLKSAIGSPGQKQIGVSVPLPEWSLECWILRHYLALSCSDLLTCQSLIFIRDWAAVGKNTEWGRQKAESVKYSKFPNACN